MEKFNKLLKGSILGIILMLVYGICTFLRTKVILSTFGAGVNSISQIANQIFSYLILFESGLGAAYLFKMYKPYADKEIKKVASLYLGLKNSLKKISLKMMAVLILIAIIYPLFIDLNNIGYVQAILIIIILGIRFIIPYYFTLCKKNLMIVTEKRYINDIVDGLINICTIILEILLIKLGCTIEIALTIGILTILISNKIYDRLVQKYCKEIINCKEEPCYETDGMTKDIIVHQIASLANSNIDTIILSMVDLISVTTYSAYNSIMMYPINIVNKITENLRGSIGIRLHKDKENAYKIFQETLSLNFLLVIIIVTVFMCMANQFIELWIGKEYTLEMISLILFGFILFHRLIINTIYIMRDAAGLYKESKWYTLIQAVLNIIISILLVKPLGIKGLLIGTVVPTLLVSEIGNFYLVYKKIFNKSIFNIYKDMGISFLCIMISILLFDTFIKELFININWLEFILQAIIITGITTIIALIVQFITNKNFKNFIYRFIKKKK